MNWRLIVFCFFLLAAGQVQPTRAASCLSGGCHQEIGARKYLHGPIAAEQAGNKGCVACHVPAGRECAQGRAGSFQPLAPSTRMCQVCHSRGTGTQHSSKQIDCLKCHDPHGSNRSTDLLHP
ncbi:MAG: hypothetical protein ACYC9M_09325 [Desulfobulbaceae bacterium]